MNEEVGVEIQNDRLSIPNVTEDAAGDYYCRGLREDKRGFNPAEWAMIKVRPLPQILDFGPETSHTGLSTAITLGDRLELTCTTSNQTIPVNVTWYRSITPDDDQNLSSLEPQVPEIEPQERYELMTTADPFPVTFDNPSITVKRLNHTTKRLVIDSVTYAHRNYYVCVADNGVSETRKAIFVRVKDKYTVLWPSLGIVTLLFVLFTIIYVSETLNSWYREYRAFCRYSKDLQR